MYVVFLLDWLTVFQSEQILVLRLEDYAANFKVTIKKVFDFLRLSAYPPPKKRCLHGCVLVWLFLPLVFTSVRTLTSSLQVLCRSRWRQHCTNGPNPTPGGRQIGTWVTCFQPPVTSSEDFTNPSTINWPVCWTTRPSTGVMHLKGHEHARGCGWPWMKHQSKKLKQQCHRYK